MQRRHVLLGVGAAASGSALIGTGAFSRVESQRDVTIEVAEDPDAYLGLEPADTPNGQNFADTDTNGHLAIDIGDFGEGEEYDYETGEGVNTNSTSWFDCVFEVRNQGKEDAGFYIDEQEGLGTGEGEIDFYVGDAASEGDSGITSIVGLPVEIELDSGEAVCVGVRVNSPEEPGNLSEALFEDDITMIADVGVEGSDLEGGEDVVNATQGETYSGFEAISDAIGEANSGDRIVVGPGTYGRVDINEQESEALSDLTLEGPNAGTPGDSDSRGPEATITDGVLWTNRNGITVDGFEVEREVGDGNGVFELGSGGDARIGENAVVKNNVINAIPDPDDLGNQQTVVYEAEPEDDLIVENNLMKQEDPDVESVVAINAFEIATSPGIQFKLDALDNVFETDRGPQLGTADTEGTIEGNKFETGGLDLVLFNNADMTAENNEFVGTGEAHRYVLVGDANEDININDIEENNEFDPEAEVDTDGNVLSGWDALVQDLEYWTE